MTQRRYKISEDGLVAALKTVHSAILHADQQAADWRAEREKRRRQEALILRGLYRRLGTQRAVAAAVNMSQSVVWSNDSGRI